MARTRGAWASAMAGALMAGALPAAAQPAPAGAPLHPDTARSGGTLTPAQEAFDVRHYGLTLEIDPAKKALRGTAETALVALTDLAMIELDLDPRYAVDAVTVDGQSAQADHSGSKLTITPPAPVPAGTRSVVTVAYAGFPHQAERAPWQGGFDWKTTPDGRPYIATAVQGRGCDLWRPCKDHFRDKPDEGLRLDIIVPEGLAVATNGVLIKEQPIDGGRTLWRWRTGHATTGYAVALNIAPYVRIQEEWARPGGRVIPVEFWALPQSEEKARALLRDDGRHQLAYFEEMLGPYPWGDEKLGFVETFHLGMEHQSINAYGNRFRGGPHGYDWLLFHEMAHEWFGNLITQGTISDIWLHEGYASFMEAAYAERLRGRTGYLQQLAMYKRQQRNCQPVVNPAATHVEEGFSGGDVYTKGGWMLHVLRQEIGDEAFWRGTRRLLYGTAEPASLDDPSVQRHRTTDDFLRIMSDEAGRDVRPLVAPYLFEASLPILEVEREDDILRLTWTRTGSAPFALPVTVMVDGTRRVVDMPWGSGFIRVPQGADIEIDPDNRLLRADSPAQGTCRGR